MSILLDALRKSEQRERLGDVPDIHSEALRDASGARRSWLLPAVAVLVLAPALAGGYLAWRWWSGNTVDRPVAAGAVAVENETAGEASAPMNGSQEPTAPRFDRQPRSPVETLSGDRPFRPAGADAMPGADRLAGQVPPQSDTEARTDREPFPVTEPATELAEAMTAVEPPADTAEPAGTRPIAGSAQARQDAVRETVRGNDRNGTVGRDEDAGMISYWQVPEFVRENLPPFKINVLVYDQDPDRRFIIMGGKRLQEGADLGNGLTLREIRRDRVVFRSGVYRFYVTQ